MFLYYHFPLACLALQTENILQKITQPIFVSGNFVNQNKIRKMGQKAHTPKYFKFHNLLIFLNREGTGTCESHDQTRTIVCQLSVLIHAIITSNLAEALLLYFCFKAIKEQAESVSGLIGPTQYQKRKR